MKKIISNRFIFEIIRTFIIIGIVTFLSWSITKADTEIQTLSSETESSQIDQVNSISIEPNSENITTPNQLSDDSGTGQAPEPEVVEEVTPEESTTDSETIPEEVIPTGEESTIASEEDNTNTQTEEPAIQTSTDTHESTTSTDEIDTGVISSSGGSDSGGFLDGILNTAQGVIDTVVDIATNTVDTITDLINASTTPETIETLEPTPEELINNATSTEILFTEEETDLGKLITVSAPNESTSTPIVNVLASTTIPEIYKVGDEDKIQIKWKNNDDQQMSFNAYDTDGNDYIDYVEWTIPHLSTQIFEIIFISKAFQLDSDLTILADIYDTVKKEDGDFVTIADGEYVRVTFEKILNNTKDNTVYAKATDTNNPASIEIYPVYVDSEGNHTQGALVATITDITEFKSYQALLTNLNTPTDIFDLKIIGSVEIDYIVDPISAPTFTAERNGSIIDPEVYGSIESPGTQGVDYPGPGDTVDVNGYQLVTGPGAIEIDSLIDSAGGGTLRIYYDFTVADTIENVPLYIDDTYGPVSVTGDIVLNTSQGLSAITVGTGLTLMNYTGTITNSDNGYAIYNDGTISNLTATINTSNGTALSNNSGAVLTIDSLLTILNSGAGPSIVNEGTIQGTGNIYADIAHGISGTLDLTTGLAIDGTLTNTLGGSINPVDDPNTYSCSGNGKTLGTINDGNADYAMCIPPLPPLTSNVDRCGIITSSGTYTLSTNLSTSEGDCIIVDDIVGGVVIDGGGYTIDNSGSEDGIQIDPGAEVVITNITINNTGSGDGIDNNGGTITAIGDVAITNTYSGTGISNSGTIGYINIGSTITNTGNYGILNYGTIDSIDGVIDNLGLAGVYTLDNSFINYITGTITNSVNSIGEAVIVEASDVADISGTIINDSSGAGSGILLKYGGYITGKISGMITNTNTGVSIMLNSGSFINSITETAVFSNTGGGYGIRYQNDGDSINDALINSIQLAEGVEIDINGNDIYTGSIWDIDSLTDTVGSGSLTLTYDLTVANEIVNVPLIVSGTGVTITADIDFSLPYSSTYNFAIKVNSGGGATLVDYIGTMNETGYLGIYNEGAIGNISGTINSDNTNAGSSGGTAIYNTGSGSITGIGGQIIAQQYMGDGYLIYNEGSISDISGTVINVGASAGSAIYNSAGSITYISGTIVNSANGVINSGGTIGDITGIIYNFSGGSNSGLENTNIGGIIFNLPVLDGYIWINSYSDNDWDNAGNWLLGVVPNKTTDNIILRESMTLPSDIDNPVYFAANYITLTGSGYTVDNSIYGVNGNAEIGINSATAGFDVNISDLIVTGVIYGGEGVDAVAEGFWGSSAGSVSVTNSTTSNIFMGNGGNGNIDIFSSAGSGGVGGSVTVSDSTVNSIYAGNGGYGGYGGSGGSVTISNSEAIDISSGHGGYAVYFNAGEGGAVTVSDSTVNSIFTGDGGNENNSAITGNGGAVSVSDSIITTIITTGDGGGGFFNNGGNGGSLSIDNSSFGAITVGYGGLSILSNGGNGGATSITDSDLDLSSITVSGGVGGTGFVNGSNTDLTLTYQSLTTDTSTIFNNIGTLTINGTSYEDTNPTIYSTQCGNGVSVGPGCAWNGVFNPVIYYFYDGPTVLQPGATNDGDWNNPNNWYITADYLTTNDSADQTGLLPNALNQVIVYGQITQNTGDPAIADTVIFNGTSTNSISITVSQNVIFNDDSSNSGSITLSGTATFNDSGSNTGTITAATSTFYGDLTSTVGGTIAGFLQRIFESSATTLRDFTTEGGRDDWTIISTGINTIVDLSNAIYDIATNIFKGLLGGSFISNDSNVYSLDFETWTPRGTFKAWRSITSSSDGTKLAAVANSNYIYTSTDSGATWAQVPTTSPMNTARSWTSITSSSDGTKLAAVANNNYIYTSTDSGATWTQRGSARQWRSISSSSDGTKLVAAANSDYLYVSTDSGVTWNQKDTIKDWRSVTSSSDGTKLAAVVYGGQIYTSTDSGLNWTPRDSLRNWQSVTSSSDGTKLAAVVYGGQIYTSTDSGLNWTPYQSNRNWQSITSSSDGTKLAAVVLGGQIYTSADSGATWTPRESVRSWYSITSSSDGTKLAAAPSGYIYTSEEISYTGLPVVPSVTINSPIPSSEGDTIKWVPDIDWGTAVSCEYSYDNYVTMNTLDCAEDGADLPRPAAGEYTLSVRATDSQGGLTEKSVNYIYDNTVPTYTMCGDDLLDEERPYYYLDQNVTGPCTISVATTLRGNIVSTSSGYTVTGDVVSNGQVINLSNITVTGTVDSVGGSIILSSGTFEDAIDSDGGNITASNSTLSGTVASDGGTITTTGTTLEDAINSYGGTISFSTSDASATITSEGGNITISNSTTTDVIASGNSDGENGGTITIATSTTGTLYANGADGTTDGGNGGGITITNSYATPVGSGIFSNGGNSTSCGSGGDSGLVTLILSTYGTVTANGGSADDSGCPGSGGSSGSSQPPSVQGSYTPPSSGGNDSQNNSSPSNNGGNGTSQSGLIRNLANPNINPLEFTPIQQFTPFSPTFNPRNLGATVIPDPFKGFNPPGKIQFVSFPINIMPNISAFLFAPIPSTITDALANFPRLQSYMSSVGLSSEQDLASLTANPEPLQSPDLNDIPPGLFIIKSGNTTLTSYATYDQASGGLAQLVKVSPNQSLSISLIPLSEGEVTAQYLGQTISFQTSDNLSISYITTPNNAGRYVLKTSSSPIPLLIEVETPPAPPTPVKKPWGIFNFIWKLFNW